MGIFFFIFLTYWNRKKIRKIETSFFFSSFWANLVMITYGTISWEARKYIFWTKIFAIGNTCLGSLMLEVFRQC